MGTAEYLPMFLAECREHLQKLNLGVVRLEEAPDDGSTIDEIFRGAHSLKGMSGAMGFARIAGLTHQMEDVFDLVRQGRVVLGRETVDVLLACLDALSGAVDSVDSTGEESLDAAPLVARLRGLVDGDPARPAAREAAATVPDVVAVTTAAAAASGAGRPGSGGTARRPHTPGQGKKGGSSTVRVDSERLDQLMHLMGELVVHRTRVASLVGVADVPGLAQAMQHLTRSSQALQAMVMQVRMIPVEAVFMRFPRLVRDLSSKLGKQVELVLTGSDTELDRAVVEALGDPIVHLVRNALDHGLEGPAGRAAAGKPETGRLEIEARHAGGNVVIVVRDDGRGIDPARVARKAVERGLLPPELESTVDVRGAIELLFVPGFSTAERTTAISGRGVGMDAVRTAIRELGGDVVLGSEPGNGTVATIRLPLTLAVVATLVVEAGGHPFAIQLDRVERTVRLDEHPVLSVAGKETLMLPDGGLPLVDLSDALGHRSPRETPHAVIVRGGDRRLALAVERLIGRRELVTRALPAELSGAHALSGGAVLANGDIALIVDCDALADEGAGLALDVADAA